MRRFALTFFAMPACALLAASPAFAVFPDGDYRCVNADGVPAGMLTIKGADYTFQAVADAEWTPKPEDPANGSGKMMEAGVDVIMVESGPIKDTLDANLSYKSDEGAILVNGHAGPMMTCRPN